MEAIAFLAFVLALAIGTAIGIHMQRTNPAARREALRRQLETAQRRHAATKDIQRKLVRATVEQLKKECSV